MKQTRPCLRLLAGATVLIWVGHLAQAQLGTGFTYQGQLGSAGTPVTDTCHFEFSLWDDPLAGTQIGTAQHVLDVQVAEGLFTVLLNAGGEFGSDPFAGQACWLEVTVAVGEGAPVTLSPRQPLTPTPYAFFSNAAPWTGLLDVPDGFADGVDNDTTYEFGEGLEWDGITVSLDPEYQFPQGCADGQVPKWNATTDLWECAEDQTGGDFWSLTGNDNTTPGTHFVGTTNPTALELCVNSTRALRIEPSNTVPNLIGGDAGNTVTLNVAGATIGGGGLEDYSNRVTDDYGTVGGGANNQAGDNAGPLNDKTFATVGGGISNTAGGQYATVGGGRSSLASRSYATIGGGWANFAEGDFATIAGGGPSDIYDQFNTNNRVYDHYGTIGGGGENRAGSDDADPTTATYTTVGGGLGNQATGHAATVPGGNLNSAAGDHSFAAGRRAKANHQGSFVWADSTDEDFTSTDNDQFIIRADGGVGIGTNEPSATLHLKQEDFVYARFDHGGDRNWTVGSSSLDNQALSIVEADGTGNVTRARFKAGGDIALAPVDGNVGIGTSWPSSPLTVVGVIESTTGGFKFPDGTTQTTAATGGGASLWNQSGSDIYYDAGNVGIGTGAPAWPLDVEAPQAVGRFVSTDNTYGSVLELRNNDPNATHLGAINFRNDAGAYVGQLGYSAANAMTFRTNEVEALRIDDSGNVGIGTSTPYYPLHVIDDAPLDGGAAITGEHAVDDSYGTGVKGLGGRRGVEGVVLPSGSSTYWGVHGQALGGSGTNVGVQGHSTGSGFNYGVYGSAGGGGENHGGHFTVADVTGTGIYAEATYEGASATYGGHFKSRSENGSGMYAEATGDTGRAIIAEAPGTYGIGVYAEGGSVGLQAKGTGALAVGILAETSPGGWSAEFRGNVKVVDPNTLSTVIELGTGLDYAEGFDVSEANQVAPGMVVIIDPENPGKLAVSTQPYDRKVAGIVAGANGLGSAVRLGPGLFDHDVALAGRVYCNVDGTYGGIEPGDLLTTSPTTGYAMKVSDYTKAQGAILGKAMEKLDAGEQGQILVLVTLQ